jgi:alpha-beta hydrolase superfamily lysophospholipase
MQGKTVLTVVAVLIGVCCLLVAAVYTWQEALLFDPEPLPAAHVFDQPDVVEVWVPVKGAQLSALHLRLPNPKGVVFFLHGNGGNLDSWFVNIDFYRQANFDLFMIDYRGYGKSGGRIRSEAQLRADVAAAWQLIAPRYQGLRKVFLGRSLGSGLVVGLAASLPAAEQPDLTILVSPYWSMTELERIHYPLIPAALLRYPLETFRDIGRIQGAVLLLHGDRDALIPFSHSQRLQVAARAAQLVPIPGAAHNDLQDFLEYKQAIVQRLADL